MSRPARLAKVASLAILDRRRPCKGTEHRAGQNPEHRGSGRHVQGGRSAGFAHPRRQAPAGHERLHGFAAWLAGCLCPRCHRFRQAAVYPERGRSQEVHVRRSIDGQGHSRRSSARLALLQEPNAPSLVSSAPGSFSIPDAPLQLQRATGERCSGRSAPRQLEAVVPV